jgi:hypothetical protein
MNHFALLLALFLLSCAPSQHDARYGTVRVAIAPEWIEPQRSWIQSELQSLNALGPTFIESSEGSSDVTVRPFDSGPNCQRGAGMFVPGSTAVYIDPACVAGEFETRRAAGHEIGHWLHMEHVPAERGAAMMNPGIGDNSTPETGEVLTGSIAIYEPTQLDLDEFRRTRP